MGDSLLETIQGLIRRGDDLHAQRVAELEKAVAGLQEVLRDLAGAAMKLTEINAPAMNFGWPPSLWQCCIGMSKMRRSNQAQALRRGGLSSTSEWLPCLLQRR